MESIEIAIDDDAVEAVIYKNEKIAKQRGEGIHGDISHRKEREPWAGKRSNGEQGKP